jgi:hypothetical protein
VEAANEGDGDAAAPWLIGAGIAAVVVIAIGGWLLKRHADKDASGGTAGDPAGPDDAGGGEAP